MIKTKTELDLRIYGGTLIDGTGTPRAPGDIGIKGGRIVEIGQVSGPAKQEIDASNLVVSPGFIDIHTHYDAQVFWDPTLSPSSGLGVTTVIGGNCGFSIAPLSGKQSDANYIMRMLARVEGMPLESLEKGVPWNWRSFDEYLGGLDGTLAINAGFMVGHSALRRAVMGDRAIGHAASAGENEKMRQLLRESLGAGGMGFSTSVSINHNDAEGNPVPSRYATREEILGLAKVVSEFEGTSLEIVPNSSVAFTDDLLNLFTDISIAGKRPLNWNILSPDAHMPELFRNQLGACDYAAARGARVVPLVSAQVNAIWVNFMNGFVLDIYPGWDEIFRLAMDDRRKALMDPAVRWKLDAGAHSEESGRRRFTADWGEWVFTQTFDPANKQFEGRKVGEVATEQGKKPFDALLDVVVADNLQTMLEMQAYACDEASWALRGQAWRDERTIIGASDAGAHLDLVDSFASAAQVLSVGVRERQLLSLEAAVRQLTSAPARLYGIREKGELKVGHWGDIVVFDPDTVGRGPVYMRYDLPMSAGRLYADPVGIKHVVVNGREIVRDGAFKGIFPGTILRSGRDTYTVSIAAE
ncbi:MAG: aminoacylase [Betaproteobacteria bacterium]|nr:aminoacylase [Betaproteobacteria bacterium]